jgi:hypothetical protein
MSKPTKGMVAGKAITTKDMELTKAFEEGYEATFGKDRKPIRGRWVYTDGGKPIPGGPVDVNADWTDTTRSTGHKSEEEIYGRTVATDGTDLSTRTRHREYMKANGLSMDSDFKEHWKTAAKQREAVLTGEADKKERREIIGRALHDARNKRLPRPQLGVLDDE